MHIVHFCPLPSFSGLEQYALLMASRQAKAGHNIEMVVEQGSELEAECGKQGIQTIPVHVEKSALGLIRAARQYKEVLAQRPNVDVVHLHTSQDIDRVGGAFMLLRSAPGWRRPKVIQQNHIWISHSKRDPLHWITYKLPDEIWCSSEMARQDLIKYLPVPESKIKVVNYGRDLSVRQALLSREEARKELSLPQDSIVVGAIARIDEGKGVWELVSAAANCMSSQDKSLPGFYLVVIGGPTSGHAPSQEYSDKIKAFVNELPLEIRSRIHLTGGIPNATRLLKAFDIYAQGSYKETFSLALLDAQLAELPVLSTNSGGSPEVVVEGKTGWLFEPRSIEDAARGLQKALLDRENWITYGKVGAARVERDFELNSVMNQMLERYRTESV